MSSELEIVLDEQKFPYLGMTKEERNYYLNIIRNCKDICDTENKVGNISKCEFIKLQLEKQGDFVKFDGAITLGNGQENRYIVGKIYLHQKGIIVSYEITRLGVECKNKVYTVLDEFTLEDNKLNRKSQYNYNLKSFYAEVQDEIMKGKLK